MTSSTERDRFLANHGLRDVDVSDCPILFVLK
jgi:hypothetical protein